MYKLVAILFLVTSCVIDTNNSEDNSLIVNWIEIDYNQIEKKLFMQLEVIPNNITIEEVNIHITSNAIDTVLQLNDDGIGGDILPQNNRFSVLKEFDIPFGTYQFNAEIQTEFQDNYYKLCGTCDINPKSGCIQNYNIEIEEQFPPEIVKIIFWEKDSTGTGSIFDPSTVEFHVDDLNYKFLDFQIIIKEINGLDDIKYARYQINVETMEAQDSCEYIPDTGFLSFPQWYLEYKETTDEGYVFDANNIYLDEPGIPIKPLILCGRVGVSRFKFIISDKLFDPITQIVDIVFEN